jgi:hypothetical protein
LPNPELHHATDPVLDDDSLAATLSESLRFLLLAQGAERRRLVGDLQDACGHTTLGALGVEQTRRAIGAGENVLPAGILS